MKTHKDTIVRSAVGFILGMIPGLVMTNFLIVIAGGTVGIFLAYFRFYN